MTPDQQPPGPRPTMSVLERLFEGTIRTMVGCFAGGIVLILLVVFVSALRFSPRQGRLPTVGPRVPIPKADAATLSLGRTVYRVQDCGACHILADAGLGDAGQQVDNTQSSAPDLSHEGWRNASVPWQMDNLRYHHRLYPNSIMPDYDDLPPEELRALAGYLASQR